jgi:Glycosyl transferase family 2
MQLHPSERTNMEFANQVTVVTACMNREPNLLKVINTWLRLAFREFIIVDWSCDKPLAQTLAENNIRDERIRVIRVEGEPKWILTHAYNIGLKECVSDFVLKLDNDHAITEKFLADNPMTGDLDARLGSWRLAKDPSQVYINGAFLARVTALSKVGFFNELITTYGWDDSYLHESLFSNGARLGLINPHSIIHIEQSHESRTNNQKTSLENELADSLGIVTTDFMNRRNMYLANLLPRQGENALTSSFTEIRFIPDNYTCKVIQRVSSASDLLDISYNDMAILLAYRDFHCWAQGLHPSSINLQHVSTLHHCLPSSAFFSTINPEKRANLGFTNSRPPRARRKLIESPLSSENSVILGKRLKYVLPTICHYYGHTSNDNSYILNLSSLGLGKEHAAVINSMIPEWIHEKVKCDSISAPEGIEGQKIVRPITSFAPLAKHLLFEQCSHNQYFWAAYNSLSPYLKRSLYELIESGGTPASNILSSVVEKSLEGSITDDCLHLAFQELSHITTFATLSEYECWLSSRFDHLEISYGSQAISKYRAIGLESRATWQNSQILTLATSLYKGSEHLVEYCTNIRRMNLFQRTDVDIHVIPSSESDEQLAMLRSFFDGCQNVRLYSHREDPGLYECWNTTAKRAGSIFIGNANVDDRRGRYHSDYLIFMAGLKRLDAVSSALVVDSMSTANHYSRTQDAWFTGMGGRRAKGDFIQIADDCLSSRNHMHCMPIWRRDLHGKIGYFDELEYGTSADWEFWIRASESGAHLDVVDLPLGFYLIDRNSHNRRKGNERQEKETRIIKRYFPDFSDQKRVLMT